MSTIKDNKNLAKTLREILLHILIKITNKPQDTFEKKQFTIESPPDILKEMDVSSNIALVYAREAQYTPMELAQIIQPILEAHANVKKVSCVHPGFLNIELADSFLEEHMWTFLSRKEQCLATNIGKGERILMEYVSANPTGDLHLGHARGAIYGDILSRMLRYCGYHVLREYYVNDAGEQMNVLCDTVLAYYEDLSRGADLSHTQKPYMGEEVKHVAKILDKKYGESLLERSDKRDLVKKSFLLHIMPRIQDTLQNLNVHHDHYTCESVMLGESLEKTMALLIDKDYVYEGNPDDSYQKKSFSKKAEKPLVLLRSKAFGDDKDRPLQKRNGSWTYLAPDIAYHRDKVIRGYGHLINIWGADHGGYVVRLKGALSVLEPSAFLEILLCHMVRIVQDGVSQKMSKRDGTAVSLRDVIKKIGADALRYALMMRRHDVPLDVDMGEMVKRHKDNPLFYVQYAHARLCSVFRKAQGFQGKKPLWQSASSSSDLSLLWVMENPYRRGLLVSILLMPSRLEEAILHREPHKMAFMLLKIAGRFHALWTISRRDEDGKFLINASEKEVAQRLIFLRIIRQVVATGLMLMGIKPIVSMH